MSDNGFIWTIDGNAPGLDTLKVGKVLFMTSRAAGRVVAMQPAGADLAVTLSPVQITEVIKDGDLHVNESVDLAGATAQEIPGVADISDTPAKFVQLAGPRSLPTPKSAVELSIGKWRVGALVNPTGLTVSIHNLVGAALKVGASVTFGYSQLHLLSNLRIGGGHLLSKPTVQLSGIDSIGIGLQGGAADGSADNAKVRVEVPIELFNRPLILPGGLPTVVTGKVKLFFETAFTGRHSTLTADGRYKLRGPLGLKDGVPTAPGFSVDKSLLDSIGGLTLGPSAMIFGAEFKLFWGVGIPGAAAGPYGKANITVGVTNGSALGASVARCRQVDLSIRAGGGAGLALGEEATELLHKIIPGLPAFKADLEAELLTSVVKGSQTIPNIPLCKV